MQLDQPVTTLPNVGPKFSAKLAKLNITTVGQLLHHYPFRYSDLSSTKTIATLIEGETITLTGSILSIKSAYLRSGKTIQRAQFSDGTGVIDITWFNQPYLVKTLTAKPQVSLSGQVKRFGRKLTLSSPQYELSTNHEARGTNLHTGRQVPVYPETAGVSSKWLRQKIHTLLQQLPSNLDWAPDWLKTKYQLISLDQALTQIHFPDSTEDYLLAKKRLSFDELLHYQLLAQKTKQARQTQINHFLISPKSDLINSFIQNLPFKLTSGQTQAINIILQDLQANSPMNRLVQGDVGSGKTIVAAVATYAAINQGYKVTFMVPTETLANQHYATLSQIFAQTNIKLGLATKAAKANLTTADLVIGTHALLHRPLPQPIGLVIIDEQHRFGVKQRDQLVEVNPKPHLLSLTATPIPRTIALTLYAALDVTPIPDMPPGRLPVKTRVVDASHRDQAYSWIRTKIEAGDQAFIVCPLISSSDAFTDEEVKAVEPEFARLKDQIFPDLRLGLIHGKLNSKQKDDIIHQFATKKLDILVATPVIEVGIDIPNATIIQIEGAERFGLASLHQLRGRVGRGSKQSYCLLFPSSNHATAINRLKHLETHQNGLELAEIDLKLRGPGDLFGLRQSGFIELKIASLNDLQLIQATHQAAIDLCYNTETLYSNISNQ